MLFALTSLAACGGGDNGGGNVPVDNDILPVDQIDPSKKVEIFKLRDGKPITPPVKYEDYVEKLNNLNTYFKVQKQNRKKRLNTTDLITYYIQTTVFVGKILGYKYPMKQFNQEIGGNYHFDFNKDVRKKLNTLINDNVSSDNAKGLNQDIETFVSENKDFIKQFGKPSKQNVERVMNQFANIGSLLNIGDGVHKPSKTIRTAIGLGLVEWIVRQTELIAAADGKKVDVRIYIK